MSEIIHSREAQLAQGAAVYNKISQLKGWNQDLPPKPYPKSLKAAGVQIRLQEEPTAERGQQVELVAVIYKANSNLILCKDGRILVNAYDDVQAHDSDAYAKTISSLETTVKTIAVGELEKVDSERFGIKGKLYAFLNS